MKNKHTVKCTLSMAEREAIIEKIIVGDPLTIDETAACLGITKSHCAYIERKALFKLRNELEKKFGKSVTLTDLIDANK